MSDSSASGVLEEAKQDNHPVDVDGMDELRRLLVGPEQQRLVELQQRLDQRKTVEAEDVSRVLPEAVTLRAGRDKKVTEALLPTVEEAINISVKKDPQVLVDALFPVIGPAIRKSISEALSGMVESLNESLEHSLSVQGLKWRIESWKTGKPFSEVVLLHNLRYRVEQVFLIHKEAGLVLQHVAASQAVVQDTDMVSGMLTAIQDFVQDSFSTEKSDTLDTLQVGELTVWIERGPRALLAGVIRGNAPRELRDVFRRALEQIHLEQGEELAKFEGDATPFEASRKHLEACLQFQYDASKQEKKKKKLITPFRVIAVILLIALGVWMFFIIRSNRRWNHYVERLKSEQGIVVTNAEKGWRKYTVTGLRDPLAADPAALMREEQVDPADVESRWEPYQALTPQFVQARAKTLLNPPDTVTFKFENGTLYATGVAPHQWIAESRRLARFIPGVTDFREDNLVDTDHKQVLDLKNRVESRFVRFVLDTTNLAPGQEAELSALAAEIQKLSELAPQAGKSVRVEIIGHTDSLGSEETNLRLSQERAEQIRANLLAKAPRLANISARGVGTGEPLREERSDQDKETNRSVTVKINLTDDVR